MSSKLRPSVKKAWVEALRSGKYEQGRNCLHERTQLVDRYCCLGVLCEVAIDKGLNITSGSPRDAGDLVDYDGAVTYLPESVYDWATTDDRDPYRRDFVVPHPLREGKQSLSALNDNGHSFKDIADLIEEHL